MYRGFINSTIVGAIQITALLQRPLALPIGYAVAGAK